MSRLNPFFSLSHIFCSQCLSFTYFPIQFESIRNVLKFTFKISDVKTFLGKGRSQSNKIIGIVKKEDFDYTKNILFAFINVSTNTFLKNTNLHLYNIYLFEYFNNTIAMAPEPAKVSSTVTNICREWNFTEIFTIQPFCFVLSFTSKLSWKTCKIMVELILRLMLFVFCWIGFRFNFNS